LAGFGGIVEGLAGAVGFGGLEIEAASLEAVGEAGEAGFAVGVGADFEVEFVEAAESVGYMDFDFSGVDGFMVGVGDGELGGAGADAGVDRRDGVRVGSLGKAWDGEQDGQSECSFEHGEIIEALSTEGTTEVHGVLGENSRNRIPGG